MTRDAHGAIDWRALHHRWWVEYNPLALLSAAVVLGGLVLLQRDATFAGDSTLVLSAVAELYALCLIGGAALLFRIGRRRSAVMLGMLAALFQADLILHVESSGYLGNVGAAAAFGWWLVFAVKLRLLAGALRLRLSRSAWAVALLGAAGLAGLPLALEHLGPDGGRLVTLWLFSTGALALWTERKVRSSLPLDQRGRRALRFTWAAWAGLALGHAVWWTVLWDIDPTSWPAVAALLAMRYRTRESQRWTLAAVALGGVALFVPASFGLVALLTGIALALAAWRSPGTVTYAPQSSPLPSYRVPEDEPQLLTVIDPSGAGAAVLRRAHLPLSRRLARGAGPPGGAPDPPAGRPDRLHAGGGVVGRAARSAPLARRALALSRPPRGPARVARPTLERRRARARGRGPRFRHPGRLPARPVACARHRHGVRADAGPP